MQQWLNHIHKMLSLPLNLLLTLCSHILCFLHSVYTLKVSTKPVLEFFHGCVNNKKHNIWQLELQHQKTKKINTRSHALKRQSEFEFHICFNTFMAK